MNDINFDELDEAVNSVMKPGDVSEPTATVTEPDVVVSDTAVKPIASVMPTKRRGQFMDMVHPSSDMTTSTVTPPPIRRQAPSVTPLNPSLVETSTEPVDQAISEQPSVSDDMPQAYKHEWPDPLDMVKESSDDAVVPAEPSDVDEMVAAENSFVSPSPESVLDDEVSVDEAPVQTGNDEKIQTETSSLSQSPFVEGAAVEKRPLGAFANGDIPEPHDTAEAFVVPEEAGPQATEPVEQSEATDTTTTEALPDSPVESIEPETTQPTTVTEPATAESGIAQSIPPQYHTDPVEPSSEEHAVFDTAQYHQPLLPPKKQHSGHKVLFYLFLGVLMLAIGATAGYMIFVLKLF